MSNKLFYENVKLAIVALEETDVVRTSIVTDNAEDTQSDFFTPRSFS